MQEKPCKQVPSEPVQGERTTVEAEDDVEAFITTAPPNVSFLICEFPRFFLKADNQI